jgi:hypothetical protein
MNDSGIANRPHYSGPARAADNNSPAPRRTAASELQVLRLIAPGVGSPSVARSIARGTASMGKRPNSGQFRIRFVLFALALTALTAFGCAQQDNSADEQHHGGFYGGVTGGWSRP